MSNNFVFNASLGKNEWWRYLLGILAPVVSIALANVVLRQLLPAIKPLFPDGAFGKTLITFVLVFLVFGAALLTFMAFASRLHQRTVLSFITTGKTFDWASYLAGFLLWGVLLCCGAMLTDFAAIRNFTQHFDATHFVVLFIVGFISIGTQSFFEEIVIRGYWLQGMRLRIKNIAALFLVNSLIFGMLHFGYGIESFLSSWAFGAAFVIIVFLQKGIEFVSGAHNANNLVLSLVLLDLSEATNESFSWEVDWSETIVHFIALLMLVALVYTFLRSKM